MDSGAILVIVVVLVMAYIVFKGQVYHKRELKEQAEAEKAEAAAKKEEE